MGDDLIRCSLSPLIGLTIRNRDARVPATLLPPILVRLPLLTPVNKVAITRTGRRQLAEFFHERFYGGVNRKTIRSKP
ncbi:MAG TPA: hypothetical protein VMT20_19430 [Terriglobia bacterium]|nr:hypothetical protein [Terriglobia bacterium]